VSIAPNAPPPVPEPRPGEPARPPTSARPRIPVADLVRVGVVTAFVALFLSPLASHGAWRIAAAVVVAACGYPIWHEAFASVVKRRMTMEFSMALAIGAALAIGEWTAALVILDFVLVAEILEDLTVSRGRRAIGELVALLPQEATVRRGREERTLAVAEIAPGDVVLVRPGARIPVDGLAVSGRSFVDEASITGEALSAEKVTGSRLYAGTMNGNGVLEVRTERVGEETVYGRIIRSVEEAERSRAPVQRLADRVAGYLVYFALGAAALTFALGQDLRATIAVVLVAGACGVAAGTPLALLGAIGSAARAGAVVKGGTPMEALGLVDTIVFDKTGTLTLGQPVVVAMEPAEGVDASSLLAAAASVERFSEHPLARAIVREAARLGVATDDVDDFVNVPGEGVRGSRGGRELRAGSRAWVRGAPASPASGAADGRSEVLVSFGERFLGAIHLADEVRPDTVAAVATLRAMGMRTVLLTGDTVESATRLGAQLGIDEFRGSLLPDEKLAHVERLAREGRTVAMVGDGVNDAPALARAHVGIAMGGGTDVATETAGVVLLGGRITALVDALRIARRCRRVIRQNFVGTIVVDAIGMLLAGVGLLPPVVAGIVHVGSELAFILNSTRLLPARRRRPRA